MIKLKNILNEEVYGNKATVYHRTTQEKLLTNILSDGFIHESGMYGEGIYTTYEPTEPTDWEEPYPRTGKPEDDNPEGRLNYKNYGEFQVKFAVDLINFFIFDWDVYQKVNEHVKKIELFTKQKSTVNNFINLQAKYFKIPYRIDTEYQKRYTSKIALKFGFDDMYEFAKNTKVNGIIFFGSNDGNVLVCYNKDILIPISVTNSDTNKTINLQYKLKSDNTLKDNFKKYFSKFLKHKNFMLSNSIPTSFEFASIKWNYDKNTDMFSYDGDVEITEEFVKKGKLVIKFDKVSGDFIFKYKNVMTLEGSPVEVGGDFNCSNTKISSLNGAPKIIGGSFDCSGTYIISLSGTRTKIGKSFLCGNTRITSFKGCELEIGGGIWCFNSHLRSLQGAPETINGDFNCAGTLIKNLDGCPKIVNGYFDCSGLDIESLHGSPTIVKGDFKCISSGLTTLAGITQKIGGHLYIYDCLKLKDLKYLPKAKGYSLPNHLHIRDVYDIN